MSSGLAAGFFDLQSSFPASLPVLLPLYTNLWGRGWIEYWLHTLLQAPGPRVEVIPATRVFVTLIEISNPAGAVEAGQKRLKRSS